MAKAIKTKLNQICCPQLNFSTIKLQKQGSLSTHSHMPKIYKVNIPISMINPNNPFLCVLGMISKMDINASKIGTTYDITLALDPIIETFDNPL